MTTTPLDLLAAEETSEPSPQPSPVNLRPVLALASVVALLCCSLELECLEQLDSLQLYMTYREIALDASAALLIVLALALSWWLCIFLIAEVVRVVPGTAQFRTSVLWRFGLAIPLSYFLLDVFAVLRLELFRHFYPGLFGWIALGTLIFGSCILGLSRVRIASLQKYSRTYLAPICWFHVVLAAVAGLALLAHRVHLFRDYVNTGWTAATTREPDIYLITIDALRADDMSVYGYHRSTTPNLEKFAQRAFVFDSFYANSNFTTPSTTTIETGKLPWSHRVFQLGGFLRGSAQAANVAELLHQSGYYTITVSSNYLASPILHRTLQSYDAAQYLPPETESGVWLRYTNLAGLNTLHTLEGPFLTRLAGIRFYLDSLFWSNQYPSPAEPVFDRAKTLLERSDIPEPRFTWTHILPPHNPYLAPRPYRMQFLPSNKLSRVYNFLGLRNATLPGGVSASELQARYDETVAYADHVVGDYLDWLDRTGRMDRSIIIVTADHGESFEHNWFIHSGMHLYNGLIHIPLLIHLPGQKDSKHITEIAQQADLLPTILDLVGKKVPSWTDGVSLKPVLEGKPLPERIIFSMNLEPNRSFDPITKGTVAVLDKEFKFVDYLDTHREYLYRYRTDPLEQQNLVSTESETATRMREVLVEKLQEANDRLNFAP